jgi:hypothetical protein
MDKKIFEQYANISGFLKKKQKLISFSKEERFFRIINGKIIAYSEKEFTKLKGIILIESIIKIEENKDDKSFKIIYPNKNYELCASSEDQKNLWITALQQLRKEIYRIKSGGKILSEGDINQIKENEKININKENDKKEKNWKVKHLDRDTFDVKYFIYKLFYFFNRKLQMQEF